MTLATMLGPRRCIVVLASLYSVAVYAQRQEGDSCVLASRPGTCRLLRQCPPLWNLLQNAGRPMPQNVRDVLVAASCGYSGNDPMVCCLPTTAAVATTGTVTGGGVSGGGGGRFQLPNIRGHRNLGLLAADCGLLEDDRIVGGNRTGLFEFPWMVLIAYNSARGRRTSCGGTLISSRYVLTAAHCVTNLGSTLTLAGVVVGEHDLRADPDCERVDGELQCKQGARNVSIQQAIPHPGYSPTSLHDDIALIRLTESIDLSTDSVKAICLPISRELQALDLASLNVVVSGWGATEDGLQSPVLLKVGLPVVPTTRCQEIYNGSARIDERQVCAGGVREMDSCGGDSGGPLQYPGEVGSLGLRYVQHGIVSFGHRSCGVGGFPGVYTRVAYYMDWILNTLRA